MVDFSLITLFFFLDKIIPAFYFLYKFKLVIYFTVINIFKVFALSNLVQRIPLSWKFIQSFFNNFSELIRMWDVFENLPEIEFHRLAQPLEIRVGLYSFLERRRFHSHDKKSCPDGKNISLFPIILRIHLHVSQLTINFSIVKNSVCTVLFSNHLLLKFLKIDFIVPDFRSVVHL